MKKVFSIICLCFCVLLTQAQDDVLNKSFVKRCINGGNSYKALEYLVEVIEEEDFDKELWFQCACEMQNVMSGLTNEAAKALYSGNNMLVTALQYNVGIAEKYQETWLFQSAQQGHKGALEFLKLKAAMQDGGSYNGGYSGGSYGSSGSSSAKYQTCQSCKGTGKCGTCNGTGRFLNGYTGNYLTCTGCSASNGRICTICNGTGKWQTNLDVFCTIY